MPMEAVKTTTGMPLCSSGRGLPQVRAARFSLGGEVLRRREVRGLRLNQRRFAARLTVFGVGAFQS